MLSTMRLMLLTIHSSCIVSIGTQEEKLKNPKPLVGLCSHASCTFTVEHNRLAHLPTCPDMCLLAQRHEATEKEF